MEYLEHMPASELHELVQELLRVIPLLPGVRSLLHRYHHGIPDENGRYLGLDDVARYLLIKLEAGHEPTRDMYEQVAQSICEQHPEDPDPFLGEVPFHVWRKRLIDIESTVLS